FADSGAGIMPINRSGVARSLAETGSGLLVGVDIEYGAVERLSGFASMAHYYITMDQIFELSPSDSSIHNKFQIRLWKEVIDVYLGLGLLDVWKSMNDLRALVGNDPLPNPTFNGVPIAAWSFRYLMNTAKIPSTQTGSLFKGEISMPGFHLRDLAKFIETTTPHDTAPSGAWISFRSLLTPPLTEVVSHT